VASKRQSKQVTFGPKPSSNAQNVDEWVAGDDGPDRSQPAASSGSAPKMKRLTFDIPAPLHKAIKARAVEEERPMNAILIEVLQQHFGQSE
jgi:hypothetical protein